MLAEPAELLRDLRAMASTDPAAARAAAPSLLAHHATEVWSKELESRSCPPSAVAEALATLRREIWLWVDGDRRWDQLAAHVGARVLRRSAAGIG